MTTEGNDMKALDHVIDEVRAEKHASEPDWDEMEDALMARIDSDEREQTSRRSSRGYRSIGLRARTFPCSKSSVVISLSLARWRKLAQAWACSAASQIEEERPTHVGTCPIEVAPGLAERGTCAGESR